MNALASLSRAKWYLLAVAVWALVYASFRFGFTPFGGVALTYEKHAQIGDLFGAFTCLFSVIAALQSIETNKKQTEELIRQRWQFSIAMVKDDFREAQSFLKRCDRIAEDCYELFRMTRDREGGRFLEALVHELPDTPLLGEKPLFDACSIVRVRLANLYMITSAARVVANSWVVDPQPDRWIEIEDAWTEAVAEFRRAQDHSSAVVEALRDRYRAPPG